MLRWTGGVANRAQVLDQQNHPQQYGCRHNNVMAQPMMAAPSAAATHHSSSSTSSSIFPHRRDGQHQHKQRRGVPAAAARGASRDDDHQQNYSSQGPKNVSTNQVDPVSSSHQQQTHHVGKNQTSHNISGSGGSGSANRRGKAKREAKKTAIAATTNSSNSRDMQRLARSVKRNTAQAAPHRVTSEAAKAPGNKQWNKRRHD